MKNLLLVLILAATQGLLAQNCLTGWDYFRPLKIYNPGPDILGDCQVQFTLNTGELVSMGKLQPNGADLRITDAACNELPYYLDSLATDTANTIWVRIPSLPASDTVFLQLYYGNTTADSVASGDSTFFFFDDFAADSVDPAKWEPIGAYTKLEVQSGILNYASDGANPGPRFKFVRTRMPFAERMIFEFNASISNSNGFGFSSADSTIHRILFRITGVFGFDTLNQVALMLDTISNGFQIEGMYPLIRYPRNKFRDATIVAGLRGDTLTVDYFASRQDSSSTDSVYQLSQIQMTGFHFILSTFLGQATIKLDYLRVRKPIPDTLDISFGPEMELIPNAIDGESDLISLTLVPNPASGQVYVSGLPAGLFTLQLVNAEGQRLYSQQVRARTDEELRVDLPGLSPGMYWISISDGSGIRGTRPIMIVEE